MYASIENCDGGFIIEVRLDLTDPGYLVMQTQRDFKAVKTSYDEAEKVLRELFMGNSQTTVTHVVEDHGKQ